MMKGRKSTQAILRIIKDFLKENGGAMIFKSDFRDKGLDPRTAERFLRIIHFCQSEIPQIEISDDSSRFIVRCL